MFKKLMLVALVFVLLAGCGPKGMKPGETAKIDQTHEFYFGVLPSADSPSVQAILKDSTEQEKINLLVITSYKYRVLPEAVKTLLLADAVWITPKGVRVENPSVSLEPTRITWTVDMGEGQAADNTVDGYNLVIRATIVASADAESGDVILKMAQFKTLELAGLYVVRVDRGIVVPNDSLQVVFDSDAYVVAHVNKQ